MVFFVAQAENCRCFLPNEKTDPAFAAALRESARQGVQMYCVNCKVTEDTMRIFEFIPAILEGDQA